MKKNIARFVVAVSLLLCGVNGTYAQERPKMRPLKEKKAEKASQGLVPLAKKEKWGYADTNGKFLIRPVFTKTMPMCEKQVGFVAYQKENGTQVWTPISYKGIYLTEQEFDQVIEDFDDRGLAVVRQNDAYGVINYTGDMVVDCLYPIYMDKSPVTLLRTPSSDWIVVVRDLSEKRHTVYEWDVRKPIIVRAENGYGIISPRNQSIVADFIYDSYLEYIPDSVYCLQKDEYKYLYADDKLSVQYQEVIPGPEYVYFVVKDSLYGVMSHTGKMLADCQYSTYLDRNPAVLLRTSTSDDWTVVVKDASEEGASVYTFGKENPIIVKAENGYGIISPRNQAIVADFIYDSYLEYIPNSVYCLQKDAYKYLYADDKVSERFDDVAPGPGNVFYVVIKDGKYGVMSHTSRMLADCKYTTCLDCGPVALLRAPLSTSWTAVVKDGSEEGSSVYTFVENEPIIAKSDEGYGIISPRNQSIVADFIYDSVEKLIPDSVYCLQKGDKKYLYADDRLSSEYEEIIPESENLYFLVKQNGLYGVVNQAGNTVIENVHTSYLNRGPVLLLRPENSTDWVAVVKDNSEVGYTVYRFAENEPIIAKAKDGYGIISPRDQSIVADFIYDSVQEHVAGSVYGLQKDADKYLYADDKLSGKYEEVILGPDNVYYVVKHEGLYGVMSHTGKMLVECQCQTYLDRGVAALLRTSSSTDWTVVVKDGSEEGSSVYTIAETSPIIVKSEGGYGIISPRNQSIVADFIYDSVEELIPDSAYCLQKGDKKYLYADDRLSSEYEEVIPEAESSYFLVKQNGLYGVVNQAGNAVVENVHTSYLNRGPVLLLRPENSTDWVAVVKDNSEVGYTVYRFAENEPIIAKAKDGYGIISPRDQSIVADFIHDSVQEYVAGSVYCLQKNADKYLYADDKLSVKYDDVIPGPGKVYYVVNHNGLYGVMSHTGKMLVECLNSTYLYSGPAVLLLTSTSTDWTVVVKDGSVEGSSVYTFAETSPIIVKSDYGYGIISPRNQSIVADFVYDSVQEFIADSVYCLQKGDSKYLYADDKMSVAYEDIIPDSENKYFIVRYDGKYGVVDQKGNVVVDCMYTTYLDRGPALLLRSLSLTNCGVVVKDNSAAGFTTYTFNVDEPIIVKSKEGYGIISPRNQSIVADFVYDSVEEYVPGSVYCLQKGSYKYLYADDCLSEKYDDVIAGPENAYYVVRQDDKYGVFNRYGRILAECMYTTYLERPQAALLRASSSDWLVVVKDGSEDAASVYTFAENVAMVVKAEGGYGIISPRDQSVVADFIYDSVQEFVPGSIYCLQKGDDKYLYADDKLSAQCEEVAPGADNAYFVVKQNGFYGVLTPQNEFLLPCSQTEVPVLLKDEYTRFYVDQTPVYVKTDKLISASDYDEYLYDKYQDVPADYLLDETLDFELKKYVAEAIQRAYGTPDFERIMHLQDAMAYADSRKFILLSSDDQNAKYLDLETRQLRDAGEVVYHAFPSKDGIPMYASVRRDGKFGLIDIRNTKIVLPFEYDEIKPIGNGYVLLYNNSGNKPQVYLYNVPNALMVTPKACNSVSMELIAYDLITVKQESDTKLYNIADHSWLLPEKHSMESVVHIPVRDSLEINYAAFAKKGSKGALFSLTTGERLTDYLFDDVAKELVDGRYHKVTIGKKIGLYDMTTRQYLLACTYERIDSYHKHAGVEYVVVGRDKKYGVYNATRKKLVVQLKYDEIELKGSYARLIQGNTCKAFSLVNNTMVSIKQQVQHIELLEDGFAVLFTTTGSGIYDLYRSRWQFSFGSRTKKDFSAGEFKDLGQNLIFIPSYGVLDYLTCKWQVRANLGWALWSERLGDYIKLTGGIEGESQAIYSLKRDKVIMNYSGSHCMLPLTDSEAMKDDYIIFYSYAQDANAGEGTERHKSPSWLPWDDAKGGAGLYNVDQNSWLLCNKSALNYCGSGLLHVAGEGIYDLTLDGWTFYTVANVDYYKEADNLFIQEIDENGVPVAEYWFDAEGRALVPVSETFSIYDYKSLKKVIDVENYTPKEADSQWKLYDSRTDSYVPFECDRISLMYE